MKSILRDSAVIGVIVLAVILAVAAVVGKAQDFVNFRDVIIAASFVIFTLLICAAITLLVAVRQQNYWRLLRGELVSSNDLLGERLAAATAAIKSDWLVPHTALREIEREVRCGEVWIVTGSLEEEIADDQFFPIVKHNIARGIRYVYFVPNDAIVLERINMFRMKFGADTNRVSFEIIDDPLFGIICLQDAAIYVPCQPQHERLSGYMNLPIRHGGTALFIRLGETQVEALVAHLRQHQLRGGTRDGPRLTRGMPGRQAHSYSSDTSIDIRQSGPSSTSGRD